MEDAEVLGEALEHIDRRPPVRASSTGWSAPSWPWAWWSRVEPSWAIPFSVETARKPSSMPTAPSSAPPPGCTTTSTTASPTACSTSPRRGCAPVDASGGSWPARSFAVTSSLSSRTGRVPGPVGAVAGQVLEVHDGRAGASPPLLRCCRPTWAGRLGPSRRRGRDRRITGGGPAVPAGRRRLGWTADRLRRPAVRRGLREPRARRRPRPTCGRARAAGGSTSPRCAAAIPWATPADRARRLGRSAPPSALPAITRRMAR